MKRDHDETDITKIINLFKKLPITEKEHNFELDSLISKINKIEIEDSNVIEFGKLVTNYDKLKEFKTFKNLKTFEKEFLIFMEKIDSLNQYYIKNIDFTSNSEKNTDDQIINVHDLSSINDISKNVELLIINSLNSNDPFTKLDLVIQAYSDIIYIVNYYNPNKNTNNTNNTNNTKKIFH